MATTTSTRNRKKLADMFDMSEPIVPHRYYPAEYVAELSIIHVRAVHVIAAQVRDTRKQSLSIPRPSWIASSTKEGKDKLRFRGADILAWQDQIAGGAPSPAVPMWESRRSEISLPKRAKRKVAGGAA